jgi:hypothetical protein
LALSPTGSHEVLESTKIIPQHPIVPKVIAPGCQPLSGEEGTVAEAEMLAAEVQSGRGNRGIPSCCDVRPRMVARDYSRT